MASLALGAAGAVVGSFIAPGIGTAIGWALGSALGAALFPTHTPKPPTDLHIQGGSYGSPNKRFWGTARMAGNVVWKTDLTEHETGGGGKGKDGPSTSTTTASFDIVVSETKVVKMLRAWAVGRLNYDVDQNTSTQDFPFTLYDGEATQLPDPTEEAVEGVGNLPAYRGVSRIVLADYDMTQFGNALPQLSFELTTKGGTGLARLSSWTVPFTGGADGGYQVSMASLDGTTLMIGLYTGFDSGGPGGTTTQSYTEYTYDLQGSELSMTGPTAMTNQPSNIDDSRRMSMIPCANAQIGFGHLAQQGGDAGAASWWVGSSMVAWPVVPAIGTDAYYAVFGGTHPFLYRDLADPLNDMLYVIGGPGAAGLWVARYPAPNGIPLAASDAYYLFSDAGQYEVTVGDDGLVYVMGPVAASGHTAPIYQFDRDLNLLQTWDDGNTPILASYPIYQFKVHEGNILFGNAANAHLYEITAPQFVSEGSITSPSSSPQAYGMVDLGGCYALDKGGIISVCGDTGPTYLWEIVSECCELDGLVSSQYDASELTDVVRGFIVERQQSGAATIETLMPLFFFDKVESSGVLKFVKRGHDPVVDIPDGDLAARGEGQTLPPKLQCIHIPDSALPARINFTYLDVDADYQINTQIAQRMAVSSSMVITVAVSIVFKNSEAKRIAETWMYEAWSTRDDYEFYTSRKYAWLEPTDVVTVQGKTFRIVDKSETPSGLFKWNAKVSRPGVLIQNGVGGVAPPPDQILVTRQATQLLMLDIPLLNDNDTPNGPYAAMAGATRPGFAGAALMESTDGGTNYNRLLLSLTPQTIGVTSTVLPDFTGVNVFDETNVVRVVIGNGGGTLSSYTEDQVLNGSGEVLIGAELLCAKNADLVAANTYDLSGLLRGRRGTEWATNTHVVGEDFVSITPDLVNVAGPFAEIGITEYYKAVTLGRTLATATAVPFANRGNALKPYSPTYLYGGSDASGNVTGYFSRRTRIGGGGRLVGPKPLSEATESYMVQIWDASYTLCARQIPVTAQTFYYMSAQQVTDFGAQQQTIYFTVGQIGAVSIGAQSRGTALGAGGSNGLPLLPITPFSFNPVVSPPPAPGGTLPVNRVFSWPSDPLIRVTLIVGQTWVGQFTTGGSPPVTGTIAVAESAGAGEQRHCWVASDSGGLNKIAGTESWGATATSFIGGRLSASTTYYWLTDFIMPDGSLSDTAGLSAPSLISLGNVT